MKAELPGNKAFDVQASENVCFTRWCQDLLLYTKQVQLPPDGVCPTSSRRCWSNFTFLQLLLVQRTQWSVGVCGASSTPCVMTPRSHLPKAFTESVYIHFVVLQRLYNLTAVIMQLLLPKTVLTWVVQNHSTESFNFHRTSLKSFNGV